MSYTGEERLTIWLRRTWMMNELRLQRLRDMHSGLDEAGVRRKWTEETHPREFGTERLDAFEPHPASRLGKDGVRAPGNHRLPADV